MTGQERPEKVVYADETGPRGDIYVKGSWVAHTLRHLIGDEAFFKAVRWQIPDNLPFPMPVDVRIGDRTVTLPMSDGSGSTPVAANVAVTFDPYSRILMQAEAIDKYQVWKAAQPSTGPGR